jgi:hypothetical protein
MARFNKRDTEEPFYDKLADFMVRHQKGVFEASIELDLGLRKEECEQLYKQIAFQRVLRTARIKLANEIGQDPNIQKETMLGMLFVCIQKLMEQDQYDKAGTQVVNYAKIAGMTAPDAGVNLILGLSGKELAEMKKKIQEQQAPKGLLN